MALSADLNKEYNYLDVDFKNAYWYIADTGIGERNGIFGVYYLLEAYPSRESKEKTVNRDTVSQLTIGGSAHYNYEGKLYEFVDFVDFKDVFETAPSNIDELKTGVYNYIKKAHSDIKWNDVFEEGQA